MKMRNYSDLLREVVVDFSLTAYNIFEVFP